MYLSFSGTGYYAYLSSHQTSSSTTFERILADGSDWVDPDAACVRDHFLWIGILDPSNVRRPAPPATIHPSARTFSGFVVSNPIGGEFISNPGVYPYLSPATFADTGGLSTNGHSLSIDHHNSAISQPHLAYSN
jgi:hypothetical protein